MNDGQTYNVTNGKDGAQGEPGAAGDKVVIDEATGAIIINDKETGYFAVKNTETGKVVVPTIDFAFQFCNLCFHAIDLSLQIIDIIVIIFTRYKCPC